TDAIGDMAPGASVTIHVSAVTPPGYGAALTNTATATSTNASAAAGASATDVVNNPNMFIHDIDSGTVSSTDPVSFTIVVGNGPAGGTAYGVVLSVQLPDSGTLNWTTDAGTISNGILTDNIGDLLPGQSVTIHVSAVTPPGYGAALTNTATASPTNASAAAGGSDTDVVQAP